MSSSFASRRTALTAVVFTVKKVVGTVEQYSDEDAARRALAGLVSEINSAARRMNSRGGRITNSACRSLAIQADFLLVEDTNEVAFDFEKLVWVLLVIH
jgi:hypothetical protein